MRTRYGKAQLRVTFPSSMQREEELLNHSLHAHLVDDAHESAGYRSARRLWQRLRGTEIEQGRGHRGGLLGRCQGRTKSCRLWRPADHGYGARNESSADRSDGAGARSVQSSHGELETTRSVLSAQAFAGLAHQRSDVPLTAAYASARQGHPLPGRHRHVP